MPNHCTSRVLLRVFFTYAFLNFAVKLYTGSNQQDEDEPSNVLPLSSIVRPQHHDPIADLPLFRRSGESIDRHWCLWSAEAVLSLSVFITQTQDFDFARDDGSLVWKEDGVMLDESPPNKRSIHALDLHLPADLNVFFHV